MHSSHSFELASLVVVGLSLMFSFGGTIGAFVLALRSGQLSVVGKIFFGLILVCGIGFIPAMTMGWRAVQRGALASVDAGGDPLSARREQIRYKKAVATAVLGTILGLLVR